MRYVAWHEVARGGTAQKIAPRPGGMAHTHRKGVPPPEPCHLETCQPTQANDGAILGFRYRGHYMSGTEKWDVLERRMLTSGAPLIPNQRDRVE